MNVRLHPILSCFWLLSILLDCILARLSLKKFRSEKTTAFTLYIACTTFVGAALFVSSFFLLGWTYTIIWAIGSVVEQILAMLVALSCCKSLFRIGSMPAGFFQRFISPIVIVGFLASALYARHSAHQPDWLGLELAGLQSTTTFIAGVFWVLSFVSDRYGIPWRTRSFGIGLGFLFQFSVAIVLHVAYLYSPVSMYWIIAGISIVSHIIASLIWMKFFLKTEQKLLSLTNEELSSLEAEILNFKNIERVIHIDSQQYSER